jgi:hypothetical protein
MSDYFLNKLYDSLLRRKQLKTKSTFRTLSESYNLVYEEEQTPLTPQPTSKINFDINEPKLTLVPWTNEQYNLYLLTADKKIAAVEDAETGVGPGEYAIASVISGKVTFDNELRNMVSGQSESFDVTWPNKDNPDYKFEVKKIEKGSVRIAKHGAKLTGEVIKDVTELLNSVLDEYDILDEKSKEKVDGYVLASLPELRETRKADRQKKLHRMGWSIGKWARGIIANTRELPFTVLFSDKEPIFKRGEDGTTAPIRVLISVKTFSDFIENAKSGLSDETENLETADADNERVKELKIKFKEFYGTSDTEKAPTLHKEIEKTAETVDKKLTKLKIQQTGEGKSTSEDFFKAISKLKISEKLNTIKQKIESDESIKSLFPTDLTGLFIVNSRGYHYVPYNDLSKYIEVEKISSGGPKIRLKQYENI